jgi:3-oxoacyl-[acyl-carrier-protein] synthase-3
MINSKITGTGSYLPEKILSNYDLEKMVDTNHDWIIERTGISERRIASPQENTTDLAAIASLKAIEAAGLTPKDIDFIYVATTSSDRIMPNSASVLQKKIGAGKCGALDIYAACTGFLYGLSIADLMIKAGVYKNILIVGAEIISRYTDYSDRGTCILFGDGAGAVVLSACDDETSKVYGHKLRSDGELSELLTIPMGGSQYPVTKENIDKVGPYITMEGREIFKNATRTMAKCCDDVLKQTKVAPDQIDWLIPHQANLRIIESVAKKFGFPMEKVIVEIEKMGNNSSATIPICLDKAVRDGRVKRGQNVLLTAFGGGITSGSLLMRY